MAASGVKVENWWAQVLRGIAAIAFGLVILFWPEFAVFALRILIVAFGLFALVDGVLAIVGTFRTAPRQRAPRWSRLVEGAAGIIVGLLVLFWPGLTSVLLLYVIAGWAIVTGILKIVAAVPQEDILQMAIGAVAVLFGLLLIVIDGGATEALQIIAVFAIIYGFLLLLNGFRLRAQR